MVKDEDDEKRLAPSDFLLFTSAGNFANLILSDSLTLIKLHDLHAQHTTLAVVRSEKYLLGS